jgi:hypothetical protein
MFMKKFIPILLLAGCALYASAAHHMTGSGGDKKKEDHKAVPAPFTFSNLKSATDLQLTLKNSLQPVFQFKGDFTAPQQNNKTYLPDHSLMTYQQGNTIYIFPYKQPTFISHFKTPERILR